MKRCFLLATMVFGAAGAAHGAIIYDTMTGHTGGWTTTGSSPRHLMADGFSVLAAATGKKWAITKVESLLYVSTAGSYNLSANVKIWNEWSSAGFGSDSVKPVFQNLAGSATVGLGTVNPTGVAAYIITINLPTPIVLQNTNNIGLQIDWLNNGVGTDTFATGLWDIDPNTIVAGTSSTNLFYRDVNGNGWVDTGDGRTISGWTNSNAAYRITATAVPEPATMVGLALGAIGLVARRRRRK